MIWILGNNFRKHCPHIDPRAIISVDCHEYTNRTNYPYQWTQSNWTYSNAPVWPAPVDLMCNSHGILVAQISRSGHAIRQHHEWDTNWLVWMALHLSMETTNYSISFYIRWCVSESTAPYDTALNHHNAFKMLTRISQIVWHRILHFPICRFAIV